MSDTEFDLLEELYFIQTFDSLQNQLGWEEAELAGELHKLYVKGWLRCVSLQDGETPPQDPHIEVRYRDYHYVASKEGLMAHNLGA